MIVSGHRAPHLHALEPPNIRVYNCEIQSRTAVAPCNCLQVLRIIEHRCMPRDQIRMIFLQPRSLILLPGTWV